MKRSTTAPGDLGAVTESSYEDQTVEALADAQAELVRLKEKMREERVGWIVAFVIMFDCAFLLDATNWAGPIVIGIMQIAILAIVAKRLGVEEFYALFMSIMERFGKIATGKDD